jgi:hypothetical protein
MLRKTAIAATGKRDGVTEEAGRSRMAAVGAMSAQPLAIALKSCAG